MAKYKINYKNLIILLTGVSVSIGGTVYGISSIKNYREKKAEEKRIEALRLEEERIQKEKEERAKFVQENKIAYLTFDDGPHATNTTEVLDILKANNIKATFFMVGNMVEKNPELVKRIDAEGHTIGNHTTNHKYKHTAEEFKQEIEITDKAISNALGREYISEFIRVPGGGMGKTTENEVIKEMGRKSIDWTGLSGDADGKAKGSTEYVVKQIKKTVGNDQHEIILMHDSKSVTHKTLQEVIDYIKEQGYVFEPLASDCPVEF